MARLNLSDEQTLSKLISEIKKFPIVTKDEEYTLVNKWKETKNQKALELLLGSHMRLVIKIAKGYSGYGLPIIDLVSEGNVGMMLAVDHFDPSTGYRFSTYASWWIKSKIQQYVYDMWSVVKPTATNSCKKIFFSLRKIKSALGIQDLSDEQAEMIAKQLNVPKKDILMHESRFSQKDFSTHAPISSDSESQFEDLIESKEDSPAQKMLDSQEYEYRKGILHKALDTLNNRERNIFCDYRLGSTPKTLRELANKNNLSIERIRQIDQAAFAKVHKFARNTQWNTKQTHAYLTLAAFFINV